MVWQAEEQGGDIAKTLVLARLQPQMTPALRKRGLEYEDVTPVLLEIDSLDRLVCCCSQSRPVPACFPKACSDAHRARGTHRTHAEVGIVGVGQARQAM